MEVNTILSIFWPFLVLWLPEIIYIFSHRCESKVQQLLPTRNSSFLDIFYIPLWEFCLLWSFVGSPNTNQLCMCLVIQGRLTFINIHMRIQRKSVLTKHLLIWHKFWGQFGLHKFTHNFTQTIMNNIPIFARHHMVLGVFCSSMHTLLSIKCIQTRGGFPDIVAL